MVCFALKTVSVVFKAMPFVYRASLPPAVSVSSVMTESGSPESPLARPGK